MRVSLAEGGGVGDRGFHSGDHRKVGRAAGHLGTLLSQAERDIGALVYSGMFMA